MAMNRLPIPEEALRGFCRKAHIRRLALFGSALRDDFGPQSDIDVLVEFERDHVPGFLRLAAIERDLSQLLGGRKVDMHTAADLSRYFRDEVVASAVLQYAER